MGWICCSVEQESNIQLEACENEATDERNRYRANTWNADVADFDDQFISVSTKRAELPLPSELAGWSMRLPSPRARRWSALRGLVYGLVWAFPFVAIALVWRRIAGSEGNTLWPTLIAVTGGVLLILWVLEGILSPRYWWFAYTSDELIVEHGLLFKRRDHLAFDRVQYLERRAGPIMRSMGLSSLDFDTAAGRASIPAAEPADITIIEAHVRAAMLQATVL